ncbi:MAG: hypothetical protein CMM48_12865 [Rhodospirillaceae bacterium]|nr:hypothetical protein [Rhodospirillaceae bacterium]HAA91641.1 hypothetical protein [Rhodospirillaceae bacterium]
MVKTSLSGNRCFHLSAPLPIMPVTIGKGTGARTMMRYLVIGTWALWLALTSAAWAGPKEDFAAGLQAHKAGDKVAAALYWEKAAKAGHSEAQFAIGVSYHQGNGVKKNFAKALHWYRKAARQGNPKAANNLGNMYLKGLGVVRDRAEALIWYRKSARLGHPAGQFSLGRMYERGIGVAGDRDEAIHWYRKAAAQGLKQAKIRLRKLGVASDSAASGSGSGASGAGTARSGASTSATKVERLRQKAKSGDAKSQAKLGFLYYSGKLGRRDFEQAAYWWRKSAEQEYAAAMGNLGTLYLAGRGVPKDLNKAKFWLEKAATKGDASAKNNLAKILMTQAKYEAALRLSKSAVKSKPKKGHFWDTLATVLMKLGEKQAAYKAWDRALELLPGNKSITRNARRFGYQR